MGYQAFYIDEKDLPAMLPKLRKAGFHIETKRSYETKTSSELIAMGYTARQLQHLRSAYEDDILVDFRKVANGKRMHNIVYNYTEMQRLGLTPTTRKKSQTT